MKINLKFFASFSVHLPEGAKDNEVAVQLPDDITVHGVLDKYGIPRDLAQIVLINGVFVLVPDRDSTGFKDGDTFAVWPAVAGG